jgi:hypothetical protein
MLNLFDPETPALDSLDLMNRNRRRPKKSNHGARPCSSYGRRSRKLKWVRRETIYAPKTKRGWRIDEIAVTM